MLLKLTNYGGDADTLVIDATQVKTPPMASNLGLEKGGRGRLIGCTKGGMNSKLRAVTAAAGRPLQMFLTARLRSGYIGV